jgi:hypothetical protein
LYLGLVFKKYTGTSKFSFQALVMWVLSHAENAVLIGFPIGHTDPVAEAVAGKPMFVIWFHSFNIIFSCDKILLG